jgi:GrpB-like predicted nucleotidyltransferase (UPF0157 family)
MEIAIEPYSPAWALEFDRIKHELRRILIGVPIRSIEHVGSTSIRGLLAKPVLDIDIIVASENVASASAALTAAGYSVRGEQGVPLRYMFHQPDAAGLSRGSAGGTGTEMKRNTYVVVEGSISLKNHLDLRRMLLEHKDLRDDYGQAKLDLINSGVGNMDEYCKGKGEVIQKILVRAGWSGRHLEEVRFANS